MVWDAEWAYEDEPKYRGDEVTEPVVPATPNNVKAINTFFTLDGGAKISMAEFKALTIDDRNELGRLCSEELKKRNISF